MAQIQKERATRATEEIEPLDIPEKAEFDIDELLDEIDDVLEENAEAFVQGYMGANGLPNTGSPGAGGGGGGASVNGTPSGAGGNGGPGFVMVITYFQ